MKNDDYLVYTNKELVATKKCGPNQETVQITEGTAFNIPGGCNLKLVDYKIYGEYSLRHATDDTRIFDWNWDAKRVLQNISDPQFLQAMQEMEHEAGVISFETEEILQQVDLDFERRESSNLFSWAKWIAPLIAAFISFVQSIFVMGFLRLYLQARRNRRPNSAKPAAPETARIQVDFGNVTPPPVYRFEVSVTYSHRA